MEVADRASKAPAPSRRLPLARILFIVAAGALIALVATYAVRFFSAASFHHERAFRTLDEVGAQLENLQRTLTFQLNFMSRQLVGSDCVEALANPGDASRSKAADLCREHHAAYLRRLALKGPRVGLARIDEALHARACSESSPAAGQYAMTVRAERPGAPFTVFACEADFIFQDRQRNIIALSGELTETIENFVSQGYFDEVLIALENGAVIASTPLAAQGSQMRTHAERGRRLGVKDARPLLLRAETQDGKGEGALPAQPVQFTDKIAGQRYRVFVSIVSPVQETWLDHNGDADPERQDRLYLIGLKHDDLRAQLADSIGPAGRFALTVLVLLALLAWPLATLRAKAPEEPISWPEAIASLIAIVLIPATLAITVVWVWSYQGMLSWADAAARTYADDLATVVHNELQRGRDMLLQYRNLYDEPAAQVVGEGGGARAASAPLRQSKARTSSRVREVAASVANCQRQVEDTCTLPTPGADAGDRYAGWSPFSSVFATDAAGKRKGMRYTVYDPPSVRATADYSGREYFLALQQGRGWRANSKQPPYFAQRLFSGGDGSRVLQMSVPRRCAQGFCGIVTGSLSVHSLSAAVGPPLLRFAVIDQRTGQVLFHKDDGRSLSENFFVETEHDPELRALVHVGQGGRFAGYYMGGAHRFHHAPVQDAPWSVVAFYAVRDAGELSWHAALTALAAYCGVMLLILLGSGLVMWIWFRRSRQRVRNLAARFWHRMGAPCSYARWGVSVFGGGALIVLLYEIVTGWKDPDGDLVSPLTWAMCALAAAAFFVMRREHVRKRHSACIAMWLLLVAAAPAAWIALGFHDAQVRGLLRDALASASRDVVQRHAAIAGDLRRWLSTRDPQAGGFPDAWVLAQPSPMMPIAGFTAGACGETPVQADIWTSCVFQRPPLAALIVQRPLDFWRRETWRRAAQDETQQRRIDLLDDAEKSNPVCTSKRNAERCIVHTNDGRDLTVGVDLREPKAFAALSDEGRFDATTAVVFKLFAVGVLLAAIWVLARFAMRRLLGVRKAGQAQSSSSSTQRLTTVFHTRGLTSEAVEQVLASARGGADAVPLTRINLATHPAAELAEMAPSGVVLLTNLDIALTDAARRRSILLLLERLLDAADAHTIIHSRSSPLERLYHPERFPESTADHALLLDEALRWDNVLQKLEAHDFVESLRVRRHPDLAVVDHHRVWKLSTRAERLLLYQLATGRLANPRNATAIDALIARGLLRLDPWPQIADPQFEAFVLTAETSRELGEWQREVTQASGKRARTIVITTGLALLLVAVLWFNWTASDQFKILSTLLAASVAFLSQIGQAFSFVRAGAGKS